MKLENIVVGFVIFAVMLGLFVNIKSGFNDSYDIEETFTDENGITIMQRMNNLDIIGAFNTTTSAIYNLKQPNTQFFLGLAQAGAGVVGIIIGVVKTPYQILDIIVDYYNIPPIVIVGAGTIFALIVAFILLKVYLGRSEV